jgi:hypothetical protein
MQPNSDLLAASHGALGMTSGISWMHKGGLLKRTNNTDHTIGIFTAYVAH